MKYLTTTALVLFLCAALLTGCGAATTPEDGSIYSEELVKAQALVITDVDGGEPREVTDEDMVKAFVDELSLEDWEPANLPEDAQPQRTISLYQTSTVTLLAGGGDMTHLCDLITYRDEDCITLEVSALTLDFQVPAATVDYLEGL